LVDAVARIDAPRSTSLEMTVSNLFSGKTPFLVICAAAAAFVLYWHWRHALDALPYLVVLACPLMHLFMHHGHDHGAHRPKDTADDAERRLSPKGD
jgi:hypothetical protein